MEEEVDHELEEDVHSVLAQESTELLQILSGQSPVVMAKLYGMIPSDARWQAELVPPPPAEHSQVRVMLDYFKTASSAVCRNFLQSVCMLCENMPMHLESRLMSIAGQHTDPMNLPDSEAHYPSDTDGFEDNSSLMGEKSSSHLSEPQASKQPRIDHWVHYRDAVRSLLLRKWERHGDGLIKEVKLEDIWVGVRPRNQSQLRTRERPDQTPGPGDRGNRTPDPVGYMGSMDTRITLESFLQGVAGQVTVLLGQAGAGKSLLMSYMGQLWAQGLGPMPSSWLFVLLEFRQLNLLSQPLSLSELLFQYYLPPVGGEEEKDAIMEYLSSNPEQSCWVLDGYDEFHSKIIVGNTQENRALKDLQSPMPVAEFILALLSRRILPGCTLVVTCRARDLMDLEDVVDNVGMLLEWNQNDIKQYVENYFRRRGHTKNKALVEQAVDLLLSSRHLLAMSSLPALCNISCVCVEQHLLRGTEGAAARGVDERSGGREGEKGREAKGGKIKGVRERELPCGEGVRRRQVIGGVSRKRKAESGEENENVVKKGTVWGGEGAEMILDTPSSPQMPESRTQAYLTVLWAFLSQGPGTAAVGGRKMTGDWPTSTEPEQRTVFSFELHRYRSVVSELCQLAWTGLEEGRFLFREQDVHQNILKFSMRAGLLTQVELRCENGAPGHAYCFIHLTLQEFLGALRIMTSDDVTDAQLKKRFNLKTRWTSKSDPKMVFTDSLHLFTCGLASTTCTLALVQLVGGSGAQDWVERRQALVLKLLKNLAGSNILTGPKVLELCHCVQETQDCQLAKAVLSVRPTLELRNIWLWPSDMEALAFMVGSATNVDVGLDFGACSMLECLDGLPSCQTLTFRGRKYEDKFAEKLSSTFPKLTTLRKLEFTGASLTDVGAVGLTSALQNCPNITEINLSDNNLTDTGFRELAELFTKLPNLASVALGRNSSSLKGVYYLIEKMTSCGNIQQVHADGMKEINVIFSQNLAMSNLKDDPGPTVRLLNQSWKKGEMRRLSQLLTQCPVLSVLDLSGSQLDVETLRTLVNVVPKLNITTKIIVKDSCLTVDALIVLTTLLSTCPAVAQLNVRLQRPDHVSVVFSGGTDASRPEVYTRKLCLSSCSLLPDHLKRVCESLGLSSDLSLIDLSHNTLGNKGLKMLLDILPALPNIQQIIVSENRITMEGVVMLSGALCSHHNLTGVAVSDRGRDQVILEFCPIKSEEEQLKKFRMTHSSISASQITKLCGRLAQCPCPLKLDLSDNQIKGETVKSLLKVLPRMSSLQKIDLSNNRLTQQGALDLVSTLSTCDRVCDVHVRLKDCSLEPDHLTRLAKILSSCHSLGKLELRNNLLSLQWIEDLVKQLNTVSRKLDISIEESWITSQAAVRLVCTCLAICSSIHTISVSQKTLHLMLDESADLTSVSLVDCAVEGCHLVAMNSIIQRCSMLTELDLSDNKLGGDGAKFLCSLLPSMPRLTLLSIGSKETSAETSEEVVVLLSQALLQSTALQCLNLLGHVITDKGAELLASALCKMAHLRSVTLSHCCGWTVNGMRALLTALGCCSCLEGLSLDTVPLDEDSRVCLAQTLGKLISLRQLNLNKVINVLGPSQEAVMLGLLTAMEKLQHMEEIQLEGWRMADRGIEQLTRVLPTWTGLRKIRLSNNGISDQSGEKLLHALRTCSQLEELNLSSNSLGELTAAVMALILPSLTHLSVLNISENHLGSKGSISLSTALVHMKNLTKIHLTSVGTSNLCALAANLAHCNLIQDVSLGWNGCGDDVAEELANVLPLCPKLTRLDLEANSLSVVGAEALVRALQFCPALQLIRLWRNKICDDDAVRLGLKDSRLNFSSALH